MKVELDITFEQLVWLHDVVIRMGGLYSEHTMIAQILMDALKKGNR